MNVSSVEGVVPAPTDSDKTPLEITELHLLNSNLPYIILPKWNLRILVDTGSTRSFISPKIALKHFSKRLQPHKGIVRTSHGSTKYTHQTQVPCAELFNSKNLYLPFTLFHFHEYFHMLIGLDNLQTIKASVNLEKNLLQTPLVNIPLKFGIQVSNNPLNAESYLIDARSIQQIPISVSNLENGQALLSSTSFPGLEIPNCFVTVKNSRTFIRVTNPLEEPLLITVDRPLMVEPIDDLFLNEDEPPVVSKPLMNKSWVDYSRFRLDHLNPEERREIQKLIHNYYDLFQDPNEPLSATTQVKHHIRTSDEIPVFIKPYRYPQIYKQEVQRQVDKLLSQNIIRESSSPYNAPLWVVPKKMDASGQQKVRLVQDFRGLNLKTIEDKYPLPNISDLLDKLGRCTYFSTLDLASGFHQIELDEESIPKTAFSTERDHFEWVRMPFGLKNAPATFQRLLNNVLRGINGEMALVYLDDILVFSVSLQEHIDRLRQVFDRLRAANLKIQVDKTEFIRRELQYLGHIISADGVRPDPNKICAVTKFPIPTTKTEIKRFLGLLGYYRRFIKNFAALTKPLTACLKLGTKINPDDPEYKSCFEICRNLLCNDPILRFPDFNKPFCVTTDCSNVAAGAVLSQNFDGNDLPIAYASKTLSDTEQRYSTIEKELFAIMFALKTFRPYLYGQKFTLFTDHRPLQWLFSLKDPNSKLYRWRLKLSDFNFTIVYKPGKSNYVADALSRIELHHLESDPPLDQQSPPQLSDLDFSPATQMDIDELIAQALASLPSPDDRSPLERLLEQPKDSTVDRNTYDNIATVHRLSPDVQTTSQSLIVNVPTQASTSAEPSVTPLSIPTKLGAVNHGTNQIIFKITRTLARKPKIEKLFVTKTRILCEISEINFESEVIRFVQEYVRPKTKYYIFFQNDPADETFNKFSTVLSTTFKESEILMEHYKLMLVDVLSEEEIQDTIKNYHVGKTNHRGISETYEKIKRQYFWPNQKTTIQTFINKCEICLQNKYDRNPLKIKFQITPTPSRPFHTLHIDKISLEKVKFLSIICPFSRFAQLYQVRTNNSIEVVDSLIQFFGSHGLPETIISDNGAEFNSTLIKETLQLHEIEIHFISSQHPESNGCIERFHSTLVEHMRILNSREEFKREPTEKKVRYALLAYNSSIHSATGLTPLEVVSGHISPDSILRMDLEQRLVNDYVIKHRDKMIHLYKDLQVTTSQRKEKVTTTRNANREDPPPIPETIFVKNRQLQSKTKPKYNLETVDKINPDRGTVQIIPRHQNTQTKVHLSNVKRPRKLPESSQPITEATDSSSSYTPSDFSIPSPIPDPVIQHPTAIPGPSGNEGPKIISSKHPRNTPSTTSSESSTKPTKKKPRKALPFPPDTPSPTPKPGRGYEFDFTYIPSLSGSDSDL